MFFYLVVFWSNCMGVTYSW